MNIYAAIAIYFVMWWITLFAVLPFGIRSQVESGDVIAGTEAGAPVRPGLASKFFWTTIVTTIVFTVFYIVFTRELISLDSLWFIPNPPR